MCYTLVILGNISKLQLPVSHVITRLVTGTLQDTLLPGYSGYCVFTFVYKMSICVPVCFQLCTLIVITHITILDFAFSKVVNKII